MRVLVTGGSGYIGAHTAHLLAARGDYVVIADDLVSGYLDRIRDFPVVQLNIAADAAADALESALREHRIDAVIHFAARKQVGESMARPAWYYRENVGSVAQLLLAMERAGVERLVFSSSAAVYGEADGLIDESSPTGPVNPYGETKLAGEKLIEACSRAWGLTAASLRYFNVGGAGSPELGDTQSFNLIPLVFDRIERGEPPLIFGDDYDTADGTCVRDYVHVTDVAEAHLAVLDSLASMSGHVAWNIGTGVGTSVREMVDLINRITGSDVQPLIEGRRTGDPASVVAAVEQVRLATGWSARYSLNEIVSSAWSARVAQEQAPG